MWRLSHVLVIFGVIFDFCQVLNAQDIIGCGGFVKSEVEINFSLIEVKLYSKQGSLKYQTDCAPNNGYYMIPVYDKGDYVLKVEPPPGWTFEPQSVDLHIDGEADMCSKNEDINFQFTGFGVVGKVISKSQGSGPAGVTLTLKKSATKDVVKQTTSVAGGGFTFEKVLPGEYVVEGTHNSWTFDKASTAVSVGRETGNAGNTITVLGYDVQGRVVSDGEAVKGVHFVLYSETTQRQDVRGCDISEVKGVQSPGSAQLCHVTSEADGGFAFGALPCGEYTLVPFYKGENIMFDVVPGKVTFTVAHGSVVLKDSFQVTGFSVGGRVLMSAKGPGVANAKVSVSRRQQTTTGADGSYLLDSMKTGSYKVQVSADHVEFDPVTFSVTPNNPQLPDVIAARYSVCGRVIIDKIPEGLSQVPQQRTIVSRVKGQEDVAKSINSQSDGTFCTMLPRGSYVFKVVLTDSEVRAGLKLAPEEKEVTVTQEPVGNVVFSQFRAKVLGTISCLESCGNLQVSLSAVGRSEDRSLTQAQQTQGGATFSFSNIMPGKYRVSLHQEEWCWREKTLDFEVVDKDVSGLDFMQSGYILSCSLSHDITLNFAQEKKEGVVGSFNLTKGVNKFCLAQPGVYTLTPVSCHQFEQDTYSYDTSRPSVLALTAIRHKVEGTLTTQDLHQDITVTISSAGETADKPVTLGPLKADQAPPAPEDPKKKPPPPPQGPFTYAFSYWARTGEKIRLTASSGTLLFYPDKVEVTVPGDRCPGHVAKIEGRPGVFMRGAITPALEGVTIEVRTAGVEEAIKTVVTDKKGLYEVGPLHSDKAYDSSAHLEGYVLSPVEGKQGSFKAFKLGQINVMVEDEEGRPLAGVLLSLSGGSTYRSNNISQEQGTMTFSSLSPGQYFLRPMMKEYEFKPSSQIIDVLEGTSVDLKIKGLRVAYSCYGMVTSLNGEAESGVFVEAVGKGSEVCGSLQEESKTEQDGSFRIRGLQPKCDYDIRLRIGDINPHIERSTPKTRSVRVDRNDVEGVNIIAFRRINQLDLSGNVVCPTEFLNSLKVHLYRENNMDSALHSTSLGGVSFFYLPSLKMDDQAYVLKLDSSLSRSQYTYKLSETTFTANATYKHFTFNFDPKRKPVEQDMSQGSFLILPFTLLVAFLGYNYAKILPYMSQTAASLQGVVNSMTAPTPTTYSAPVEINAELITDTAAKKKQKPRKT